MMLVYVRYGIGSGIFAGTANFVLCATERDGIVTDNTNWFATCLCEHILTHLPVKTYRKS